MSGYSADLRKRIVSSVEALKAVRANDAHGFFEHCGYHAAAQLL